MNTIDTLSETAKSPLMRVGSTITTQISSPSQDFSSVMGLVNNNQNNNNNSRGRMDLLRNSVPYSKL